MPLCPEVEGSASSPLEEAEEKPSETDDENHQADGPQHVIVAPNVVPEVTDERWSAEGC